MAPTLGRLPWSPARELSHLLAEPVAGALGDNLLDGAFVAPIDPGDADTAVLTDTYDVPLEMSANCVVVLGKRAGALRPAGCVVLADTHVDVNNVVRRHIDARKASFAPQEWVVEQTQMEYGGITPVGLPDGWPILVDSRVARAAWVVVGSGTRSSKLAIPGPALGELPGAVVLDGVGT